MKLIADSADIAKGQWLTAMHTGNHEANKVVARQSKAIAIAIRKWIPRAALGGADMPAICRAFSTAVANAADEDWRALGVNPSQVPRSRWHRAGFFAFRAMALALPAGAAVIIPLAFHKITGQLAAIETILTYLPVAMLLRWLHVSEDVNAADKLSQLLLKPPIAAGSKTA